MSMFSLMMHMLKNGTTPESLNKANVDVQYLFDYRMTQNNSCWTLKHSSAHVVSAKCFDLEGQPSSVAMHRVCETQPCFVHMQISWGYASTLTLKSSVNNIMNLKKMQSWFYSCQTTSQVNHPESWSLTVGTWCAFDASDSQFARSLSVCLLFLCTSSTSSWSFESLCGARVCVCVLGIGGEWQGTCPFC